MRLEGLQQAADGIGGEAGDDVAQNQKIVVEGRLLLLRELKLQVLDAVQGSVRQDFMLTH